MIVMFTIHGSGYLPVKRATKVKAIYGDEAVDVNLDRDAVVLVDLQLPGHRWLHVCCSRAFNPHLHQLVTCHELALSIKAYTYKYNM